MSDQEIIERLVREVELLKAETARVAGVNVLFNVYSNFVNLSTITSDKNDYEVGNYDLVYLATDASRTITGIAGGVVGRRLTIVNYGGFNIVLANASGSSQTANRILTPTAGSITILPNRSAMLHYNTNWRVLWFST